MASNELFTGDILNQVQRTYKTTVCRKRPRKIEVTPVVEIKEKDPPIPPPSSSKPADAATAAKQCPFGEGPVIACIRKWREELGLSTEPLRSMTELEGSVFSRPIIGIKDLRQLSRIHSTPPMGSKHDDFIFIYCIRRDQRDPHARYNPYDLCEVGAKEAQEEAVYYTVSPHCVTQITRNGSMEVTVVSRWLWEQQIFNKVVSIPFFNKVRTWKVFVYWRRWILQKKCTNSKIDLSKKLFYANEILQGCILQLRQLIEQNENISLLRIDPGVTYSLDEFVESQLLQIDSSHHQLRYFHDTVVDIVEKTCMHIASDEGFCNPQKEPSHVQILHWRSTLAWLRRFVLLCDFMVLDFLQRLVMNALESFQSALHNSFRRSRLIMQNQASGFRMMSEAVINHQHTRTVLERMDANDEAALEDFPLQDIIISTLTPQTVEEYCVPYVSGNLDTEEGTNMDSVNPLSVLLDKKLDMDAAIFRVQLVLKGISADTSSFYISVVPSFEDFEVALNNLLNQYKDVITRFSPLLKDDRILPLISTSRYDFMTLLEEEESASTGDYKVPWQPVQALLCDYAPYCVCTGEIKATLRVTLEQCCNQSSSYSLYCTMVQNCLKSNIVSTLNRKEWTTSMFQLAFAFCHDQICSMKKMLVTFRILLVQVDVQSFQQDCLRHPQGILAQLELQLPKLANVKSDSTIQKLKVASDKLVAVPTTIESFVEYLGTVDKVSAGIPNDEAEINFISKLYNVAHEFNVRISDEDLALYKILFPQLRHLKTALVQAEATKSESTNRFSSEIKSELVNLLHQGTELKQIIEFPAFIDGSQDPNCRCQELLQYQLKLKTVTTKAKQYFDYYQLLSTIPTSKRYYAMDSISHSWTPEEVCKELANIEQSLEVRKTLFEVVREWSVLEKEWSECPLKTLKVEALQQKANIFIHTIDYLERSLPATALLTDIKGKILSFCSWLPTVFCLLNPKLKLRHWEALQSYIGGQIAKEPNFTIRELNELKAFESHSAAIADVSNSANHESVLENMLNKVSQEWMSKEFTLSAYNSSTRRQTYILGGIDDLLLSLEDALTTLATIRSSKYVNPIKHAVQDWESRLSVLMEVVEIWIACQKNWVCLEEIFASMDLQRYMEGDKDTAQQLSYEARQFQRADKAWRDLIQTAVDKLTVLKFSLIPGVLESFELCNTLLEQVFRSLEDYLETKRQLFPRFYFISDSELLNIMSHTRNPFAVQPYLSKLFGNIRSLQFSESSPSAPHALAVVSTEGEILKLVKDLPTRGSSEQWLNSLEALAMESVKFEVKQACGDYDPTCRTQWLLKHIGQATLTAVEIIWTQTTEQCFQGSTALNDVLKSWVNYVTQLAQFTKDIEIPMAKHCVLTSLLTLDVHRRDVLQLLVSNKVTSSRDFHWLRQLRYYWKSESGICVVKQCAAAFPYGNEYLGCPSRLVVTPLSERCYLTLTSALYLHLGGSPVGPSGTGKSETIKDLARAMGRFCVVINCSEELDHKMMGRFHSGMCQSGIWCCFDEFNRINVEVLSVIAQQLMTIKAAKDSLCSKFIFESREINIVPSCAAFVTMNPGYAGRFELPDNLKMLFRPIAMVVPDTAIITEVLLLANGFTTGSVLAPKLTKLYQLAAVQLSEQLHYDFGLRTMKAVIALAGDYLRNDRSVEGNSLQQIEMDALLLSLRNCNQPRLIAEDAQVMKLLLHDMFSIKQENQNEHNKVLQCYLEEATRNEHLQICEFQLGKCLQLYSTTLVRHGVMVLGPTGGGKSTVFHLLAKALNAAHEHCYNKLSLVDSSCSKQTPEQGTAVNLPMMPASKALMHCQVKKINPKCLTVGELYGYQDLHTLEWIEGVLSKTIRNYFLQNHMDKTQSKANPQICRPILDVPKISDSANTAGLPYPMCAPFGWKWVILDGSIDPEWVENLNSTLDDSKLLCLSNGERIELGVGTRILFETDDLSQASPATISRCGIVYMDTADLGWKPFVLSWLDTLPHTLNDEVKKHLLMLFEASIDEGLRFLKQHTAGLSCPKSGMSAVQMLCCMLNSLVDHLEKEGILQQLCTSAAEPSSAFVADDTTKDLYRPTLAGIYIPNRQGLNNPGTPARKNVTANQLPINPLKNLLNKLYVFAFTWSFGGDFELNDEADCSEGLGGIESIVRGGTTVAAQFDALVHKVFNSSTTGVQLPNSSDLIYSYYVDVANCKFVQWQKLYQNSMQYKSAFSHDLCLPSYLIEADLKLLCADEVGFVPTVDVLRLTFVMALLLNSGHSVVLSGRQGVGKTKTMNRFIELVTSGHSPEVVSKILNTKPRKANDGAEFVTEIAKLHFSSRTRPLHIHSLVEKSLKKGKLMANGNAMLLCLDDMHLTKADKYGSFPCIELLRQLQQEQGWYERKALNWKNIEGISILATTGSKHHSLRSERLLGKFCTLCHSEPSVQTLTHIYSALLTSYFTSNKFHSDIVQMVAQLVPALIYVYKKVQSTLLPTPQSPQLLFTTHDLSKAFSGFVRIHPRDFSSKDCIIHLMCHELSRVLSDRCLIPEREIFLGILSDSIRIYFQKSVSPDNIKNELFLYEEFSKPGKKYTPVSNLRSLKKQFEKLQFQLNSIENKNLHLQFFPLACEHVVRTVRVLQQPAGHLIMIGLAGVGRRNCIQLASHITHCQYHHLSMGNKLEYREQLKAILMDCGVKGEPCVLLLVTKCDQEQEDVLHDLHELVVCGEVHGLFNIDEVENIVSQMTDSKTAPTKCWKSFTKRVQHNLHVVLCCGPASQELERLCSSYPGLIIHSTVNVYDDWPTKALYKVALKHLSTCRLAGEQLVPKDVQTAAATAVVKIHELVCLETRKLLNQSGYSFYVTPSSFIHFLKVFNETLKAEQTKIIQSCQHLETGIHHLNEADQRIFGMKIELEQLQPEVQLKAKAVETLLQQLCKERQEMNQLKATVEQERSSFANESQLVTNMAASVESDLQAVLPALVEAERGLSILKKADLVEIRSYTTPPSMVIHVMSAVCVLLQEPTDWNAVKLLMSDYGSLMKRMSSFEKDRVSEKVLSKLKKYTQEESFTPDNVAHYSVACKSFCEWVLAIERYAIVYKMVEPKRKSYEDVKLKLRSIRSQLLNKEEQLKILEATLDQLQETFDDTDRERKELQNKFDDIIVKLERAQVLSTSLGDEQIRWQETLHSLQQKNVSLFGDAVILSAFLVYGGGFLHAQRQNLLIRWKEICHEEHLIVGTGFSVLGRFIDPELIHEWHVHGLPKDTHSIENSTIIMKCDKWPLIIDPEEQATKWLKNSLKDLGLITISYSNLHILKTIEQAIQTGVPVLVEDVPQDLKTFMDPFLEKNFTTHEGQTLLRVGKMEIEYNKSFRLFLICNLAAPHFGSEICNKTTVVNFTSTIEGVEDQLLAVIIRMKEPSLESLHNKLLLSMCADKRQLNALEDEMLHMIQSISGNILDDEELIHALQAVKQAAVDVKERIANAQESQKMVDTHRQYFQPIATRGSILYFCLLLLKGLDPVYQYSLSWFLRIFCMCIEDISTLSGSVVDRAKEGLTEACAVLTFSVFKSVAVGLSSEHFTPFVFNMCCAIKLHGDSVLGIKPTITMPEWTAFLLDTEMLGFKTVQHSSSVNIATDLHQSKLPKLEARNSSGFNKPITFSEEKWDAAFRLECSLDCFSDLRKELSDHARNFPLNSGDFWKTLLVKPYFIQLSKFQHLILLRHIAPECLLTYVKQFLSSELGDNYKSKPLINLKEVFESTDSTSPVMFILTPGTDPSIALHDLAQELLGSAEPVSSVSLGQGQEQKAETTIQMCSQIGTWAFLQNCHLAKSWLPRLETICKSLFTSAVHPNFRLWLSTMPTSGILPNIIQSCIKLSLEPPPSTKSALKQLLCTSGIAVVGRETFENTIACSNWKQLVFGLCYFHSVVKTRKAYQTVNWSLPHEFTDSDLQVSLLLLQSVLPEISGTPWAAIEYLVGDLVFGGRATTTFELMHIKAMLRMCCDHKTKMLPKNITACLEPSTSYETLCTLIDHLPEGESLSILGTNSPVETFCAATPSMQFLEVFVQLETQSSTVHQHFNLRVCDQLIVEKCAALLEMLPQPITALSKCFSENSSPYWIILNQEVAGWNWRLQTVVTSLKDTELAVKGEIVMTEVLKDVYNALASERVPKCWQFVPRYSKISTGIWMSALLDEFRFIKKWVDMNIDSKNELRLPKEFWLPAIIHPKGLFAAATQDYCRKCTCDLESMTFHLRLASNQDAVIVSGIYLSGAQWDPKSGLTGGACGDTFYKMPGMAWSISKAAPDPSEKNNYYACPLYSDYRNKDFITTVHIPTFSDFTVDHWTVQGPTMFPHTDY